MNYSRPSDANASSPSHHDDSKTHTTHTFDVPYRAAFEQRDDVPDEPAQVAPIPKINASSSPSTSSPTSPSPMSSPHDGLEGRFVDEFGNILDDHGTVIGRVEGDLPSMIGRPVSKTGDILDTDGEVVGHVSENLLPPPPPRLTELQGGLRVDDAGTIYNQDGTPIGKLNQPPSGEPTTDHQEQSRAGQQYAPPAAPAPKPRSAPSPSEIYLDVKSTFDGIQLIIKIPTILNQDKE